MSGRNFRGYRLLLDEQGAELLDMTDVTAERGRKLGGTASEHNDVATTSLIEMWIDEAERRVWFLFETSRDA